MSRLAQKSGDGDRRVMVNGGMMISRGKPLGEKPAVVPLNHPRIPSEATAD
jgi:hypothetical protein